MGRGSNQRYCVGHGSPEEALPAPRGDSQLQDRRVTHIWGEAVFLLPQSDAERSDLRRGCKPYLGRWSQCLSTRVSSYCRCAVR